MFSLYLQYDVKFFYLILEVQSLLGKITWAMQFKASIFSTQNL